MIGPVPVAGDEVVAAPGDGLEPGIFSILELHPVPGEPGLQAPVLLLAPFAIVSDQAFDLSALEAHETNSLEQTVLTPKLSDSVCCAICRKVRGQACSRQRARPRRAPARAE